MALAAGSIGFVGFNTDGDDDFAFVVLEEIPANTVIFFSDDDLDGAGGFAGRTEGTLQWTAPGTAVPVGTVVTFTDVDSDINPSYGASTGTLTTPDAGFNLAGTGDSIVAYTTSNDLFDGPPTFIAAVENGAGAWGSLAGSGLTEGDTGINLSSLSGLSSPDGSEYSGDRATLQSPADWRTDLNTASNWTFNTSDGEALLPIDDTAFNVTCFAAGTRISGPGGDQTIETLKIGDLIMSKTGRAVPVKWIGRQTVSTRFGPAERLMPVRFAAGSLGDGVPHSDLTVTADHAMLVDGVLCNAGALVNGTSITRVPLSEMGETYTVYHIETEAHEIILANGAPAETFIDNVSRRVFDNYAEFEALYGDVPEMEELPLPRAMSARQVPASIQARLDVGQPASIRCRKRRAG